MSNKKKSLTDLYESNYLVAKNKKVVTEGFGDFDENDMDDDSGLQGFDGFGDESEDDFDDFSFAGDNSGDDEEFGDEEDEFNDEEDEFNDEEDWEQSFEPREKEFAFESKQPTDQYGAPIKKRKKKKMTESMIKFRKMMNNILSEEFEEDEFGAEGGDEFGGEDEFGAEGGDEFGGGDDMISVSRSELESIQGLLGKLLGDEVTDGFEDEAEGDFNEYEGGEGGEDEFGGDSFDDEDVPLESYSGAPENGKTTNLVSGQNINKGKAKVGGKPTPRSGKKPHTGTFSVHGEPKSQKPSNLVAGQNIKKASTKVKGNRKTGEENY